MLTRLACLSSFVFATAVLVLSQLVAADHPLGHPDFRPSPDHAVGFRGDHTGTFPGASGWPASWHIATGENVAWSTSVPGWGHCSPIVVGDRVFVTGDGRDGHYVICLDAQRGQILWTDELDALELNAELGAEKKQAVRAEYDALMSIWAEKRKLRIEWHYLSYQTMLIEHAKAGATDIPSIPDKRSDEIKTKLWRGVRMPARPKNKVGRSPRPGFMTEAQRADVMKLAKAVSDEEFRRLQNRRDELDAQIYAEGLGGPNGYRPGRTFYGKGAPAPTASGQAEKNAAFRAEYDARWKAISRFGLMGVYDIGNLSASFPTPTSDGEHVYTFFGNGIVACHDLDGKRKWARFFPRQRWKERGSGGASGWTHGCLSDDKSIASPWVVGDRLIVCMPEGGWKGPENRIRCLDTATGKTIWESEGFSTSGHSVPIFSIGELDGRKLVLVSGASGKQAERSGGGRIFDLETGAYLASIPANCHGSPPVQFGGDKILMSYSGGDGGKKSSRKAAYKMRWQGDAIELTELWSNKGEAPYARHTVPIIRDGQFLVRGGAGDLTTGVETASFQVSATHAAILLGDSLLLGNGRESVVRAGDGWKRPGRGAQGVLCDLLALDWMHMRLDLDELFRRIDEDGFEFAAWSHKDNSVPFAHGDAIFYRTPTTVHCVRKP